ncbi:MAG TPA: hypothetical protein VLS48_02695, partial [Anaerolineales bacterium]|nr:hypothetical protein [Anaerolineales bacterium]
MKPKRLKMWIVLACLFSALLGSYQAARAWQALKVSDDPLVRMPGTQPGQNIGIDTVDQCTFCHFGYDQNVEPG